MASYSATRGRRMTNRAPPPTRRSTVSVPPCAATIERAMARPRPAPPPAPAPGARRVEADEGLEDPLGVGVGNARSRVLHHEQHGVAVVHDRNLDAAAARRVLDRVFNEIERRAAQRIGGAADDRRRGLFQPY